MEEKLLEFYGEVSKENRKRILREIIKRYEMDYELIRVLEYIWKIRFKERPGEKQEVDHFQNTLLELLRLDEQLKRGRNTDDFQRRIFHLGQSLGLDDYRFQTENGKQYFVREYENLAGCFIELRWRGKTDKNYVAKIKSEIETVSVILPEKFGLAGLYKPLAEGMKMKVKELYS